jgi:hypothetical protein
MCETLREVYSYFLRLERLRLRQLIHGMHACGGWADRASWEEDERRTRLEGRKGEHALPLGSPR